VRFFNTTEINMELGSATKSTLSAVLIIHHFQNIHTSISYSTWTRATALCCGHLTHTHTHTHISPGLPGWAGTRKVKPIRILLKQETVSGNGIRWAICKSAPRSKQITTPAPPHHSLFYRPDAQGRATLNSLDIASITITNNSGRNAEPWSIPTFTSKLLLLP